MIKAKWYIHIKHGLLELCILNLIEKDPMYGYQMVERLEKAPGMAVSEGTIYPLLSRLRREGYLKSRLTGSPGGPKRRVYELTTAGRLHIKSMNKAWRQISDTISHLIEKNR